jgi:large subunit ribosomal protein L29
MKKYHEITSLGVNELQQELVKSQKELHELRIANALKQLKETHKIKETRRYIAQLKTALHQRVSAPTVHPASSAQEEEKKVVKRTLKTATTKRRVFSKERVQKISKSPSPKKK